jgi:hypothetical protein
VTIAGARSVAGATRRPRPVGASPMFIAGILFFVKKTQLKNSQKGKTLVNQKGRHGV